jgi:hypothetical protein
MKVKKLMSLFVLGAVLVAIPALAETMKSEESVIDIAKLTCKELMIGNDIDREVGIAYFHGFIAGKANRHTLDGYAAGAITDKVTDYCLSNPANTVMDAFAKAQK